MTESCDVVDEIMDMLSKPKPMKAIQDMSIDEVIEAMQRKLDEGER